jgi:hypothetical protein
VFVVPAPYTGAAVATIDLGNSAPTALTVDQAGRLFVGFENGDLKGRIAIYLPPFFSGQTAAFIQNAGDGVMALAFDPAQNLYAQLASTGGVVVFKGPIARSMGASSASFDCPDGVTCRKKNWAGLAFGP